jgi:hypothetical protein
MTRHGVIWREQLLTSGHFGSSFHFVNQFPRPARKNGHPVLSSRFLSMVLVMTISSQLKLNTIIIDAVQLTPYLHSNISKTYRTSDINLWRTI